MCSGALSGTLEQVYNSWTPATVAPVEAGTTEDGVVGDNERKRRMAATGRTDTVMTRGEGLAGRVNVTPRQKLGG